ncbi:MAG: response regulator [Pseudomonadota bacterium]
MSTPLVLMRVIPEDIWEDRPLPYDIVTAEGVLLLAKGQVVSTPERVAILRTQGWKPRKPDPAAIPRTQDWKPHKPVRAVFPDDTAISLPSRGRPPLPWAETLIADDTPLIRQLLTSMLREQGIKKIDSVENGHQAMTYFFKNLPHIVFLDIDMPGIDGLMALKQIKGWTPDSFVCMVSGNSNLVNVKQAKADGVDGFLVKPISLLNLKRVLALYQASP